MKKALVVLLMVVVAVGVAQAQPRTDIPAGLRVAWNFEDQGANDMALDVSGVAEAMDAELETGAAVVWDNLRNGYVLDPLIGRGLAPHKGKIDHNTSCTLQAWVRPLDRNNNGNMDEPLENGSQWKPLVGTNNGWGPRMFTMNSGFLCDSQLFYNDPGWTMDGWNPVNLWRGNDWGNVSGWHHLVWTFKGVEDGPGTGSVAKGYVDGVLLATIARQGDWIVGWDAAFHLGGYGADQCPWLLDDVAYWHGAASDEVVAGLYSGQYTIFNAPIVPEPVSLVLLGLGGLLIRRK